MRPFRRARLLANPTQQELAVACVARHRINSRRADCPYAHIRSEEAVIVPLGIASAVRLIPIVYRAFGRRPGC